MVNFKIGLKEQLPMTKSRQFSHLPLTSLLCVLVASTACSGENRFGNTNSEPEAAAQASSAASGSGASPVEGEGAGTYGTEGGKSGTSDGTSSANSEPGAENGANPDGDLGSDLSASDSGSPTGMSGSAQENKELLELPQDKTALKIESEDQLSSELINGSADGKELCQRAFDLKAVSPDKSRDLASGTVTWKSTRPDIVSINNDGSATILGSGSVTLIAVHQGADGQSLQDHITIDVPPPQAGFVASPLEAIVPITAATAIRSGDTWTGFKDGSAKGRVMLTHPESNIKIDNVAILVHSTDFKNFIFDDISEPKKNTATCLWEVQFDIAFTYLFVPKVVEYKGQRMQVNFTKEMGRLEYFLNLNPKLSPEGTPFGTPAELFGTGTEGFSPAR